MIDKRDKPGTNKGLKRVTLCFCPMLVKCHLRKNRIWNETKR